VKSYHRIDPSAAADEFRSMLVDLDGNHLVVAADSDEVILSLLIEQLQQPGVATSSPVPVGTDDVVQYPLHPLLPPPPTLALPCRRLTAIRGDVVHGLHGLRPGASTIDELLIAIGESLLQRGWRHVAVPGVAMRWDPQNCNGIEPSAAWQESVVASMVGPANVGLEAHISWATSQVQSLSVVVDGACVTDDPHTGTQHLVVQVARELANSRPTASVALAVPVESLDAARIAVAGTTVTVVDRTDIGPIDVMYRPYQMLFASELDVVATTGRRRIVGQLDMIGFSNPFYHPSPGLFSLARNLQRHLMRSSDGVTFISQYGRDSAVADCPDLDPSRLHVVSCGADPKPSPGDRPEGVPENFGPFVLCLSATFWHKNRAHAIASFAELARTGYTGSLVVIGPEPYYGRSVAADEKLLQRLDESISRRVHFLGQAPESEKWWLLEHADAVVYPSVVEGFGLVPFEAAAVGTPSLTFAGTAPGELLSATDAVIDTWDPKQWAARIGSWVDSEATRHQVLEHVTTVAIEHSWRRCAERTWDAIDAALAQPVHSGHVEEGGAVSRVTAWGSGLAPGSTVRFTAARAAPAIRHRVHHAISRLRKQIRP